MSTLDKSPSEPGTIPHLFNTPGFLAEKLKGKRCFLFLDYDGTLTPIVERPENALLDDEVKEILHDLGTYCPVAIISGRDRQDVADMVGIPELFYAGSHGFDLSGPGISMQHGEGPLLLKELDLADSALRSILGNIPGSIVEKKRFAIAVHYRLVEEADVQLLLAKVDEVAEKHPRLVKTGGKKVIELRPDIDWHKGSAIRWLSTKLAQGGEPYFPVYLGDDLTDEDAFREIYEDGLGILVGSHGGPSFATAYLADTSEVKLFLRHYLAFQRGDVS